MKKLLTVLLITTACGHKVIDLPPSTQTPEQVRIAALEATITEINNLVLSEWATCDSNQMTSLQKQMCDIAQAATAEIRLEFLSQLSLFVKLNEEKLNNLQNRMDSSEVSLESILSEIATIQGNITALQTNITNLQTAVNNNTSDIADLETAITNLNNNVVAAVQNALTNITIGNENIAAGPLYEVILRNPTRTSISAFINAVDSNLAVTNNGCLAVGSSSIVTITTVDPHGFSVNDVVQMAGFTSCRQIPSAKMNSSVRVLSTPSATTFTVDVGQNAVGNGTGGGTNAYVYRVQGRGLGQLWTTTASTSFYATDISSKNYNFIITGTNTVLGSAPNSSPFVFIDGTTPVGAGYICYNTTNIAATLANILSGGVDIICK